MLTALLNLSAVCTLNLLLFLCRFTHSFYLDRILIANEQEILTNAGKISMEVAKAHAETEWEKYRIIQDRIYQSDFDLFLEDVKKLKK